MDGLAAMRIAGHGGMAVSQQQIHPTPETVERACQRYTRAGGGWKSLKGL